jgi:hypothetical protein
MYFWYTEWGCPCGLESGQASAGLLVLGPAMCNLLLDPGQRSRAPIGRLYRTGAVVHTAGQAANFSPLPHPPRSFWFKKGLRCFWSQRSKRD